MKKKIVIALILCIPFISILLVIMFRGVLMPTNEEIISGLKDINYYETNVEYIVNNVRGEEREETVQYYSRDKGVRVEFREEVIKIYTKDGIHIKDNISNSEYVVDNSMDILHSIAFMNKVLSYPIITEIEEKQEEWGDTIYLQFDVELFLDNSNLSTARVFVDKKERTPIGIIVFDNNGNDTLRIIYKDFKKVKQIDESLL